MRRTIPIFVVILGALGSLYSVWALHRLTAGESWSDDQWPRAWPYPDNWLAALNDWYDARYPIGPDAIKLHSELQRVRLTLGVALATCLIIVLTGLSAQLVQTASSGGLRTNYVRRIMGLVVCFAPVALMLTSLSLGQAYSRKSHVGITLAVAGLLIAGLNFYLSFVRPLLYAWRHGSTTQMRHVSGLPVIGTMLSTAAVVGFADLRTAAIGLVALALDTGGLPWFLLMTWRDRSLWDGASSVSAGR